MHAVPDRDAPEIVGLPDDPPVLTRAAAQALLAIVIAAWSDRAVTVERDNPRDAA